MWTKQPATSEIPEAKRRDRTAGEGSGPYGLHVRLEESHRGVIPMHHSNTDGFPSAEDEEGRLRIKENPFPDT